MVDAAGSVQRPIEAMWRKQVASFERNRQQQHRKAISSGNSAGRKPAKSGKYIQLARHHQQLGEYKKALEVVERGLHVCAPSSRLYRFAVMSLAKPIVPRRPFSPREVRGAVPRRGAFFDLKAKLLFPVFTSRPKKSIIITTGFPRE